MAKWQISLNAEYSALDNLYKCKDLKKYVMHNFKVNCKSVIQYTQHRL